MPGIPDLTGYSILPEGGRAGSLFFNSCLLRDYSLRGVPWAPLVDGGFAVFKENFARWYFVVESTDVFDKYLQAYRSDPNYLEKLEEYITSKRDEAVKTLTRKPPANLSPQELSELLLFFSEQMTAMPLVASTLRGIDRAITPRLRAALEMIGETDAQIAVLTASQRASFTLREERAVLELANRVLRQKLRLDGKEAEDGIEAIRGRYCWSGMGYNDEPQKTRQDYLDSLREILKNGPMKLSRELEGRVKADLERREALMERLDSNARELADVAAESTYLKDYYKSSINEVIYHAQPMLEQIARHTGHSRGTLMEMVPQEVVRSLMGEQIDLKMVGERASHCIMFGRPGEFSIFFGNDSERFERKYVPPVEWQQTEFNGRVACPGSGRGSARVVLGQKDFHKLGKGDILVVVNTSPDYVHVMRKASAIVAEEGGLTAHVSVVCREFGIPCVVGVANVTKAIRDGDQVEVDAEKGVVRVLKRA